MKCKICGFNQIFFFKEVLLSKYTVQYYKCPHCGFVNTEAPYWLEESYTEAIADLDVGLVSRNLYYSPIVEELIYRCFDCTGSFLDYGGGYGLFVRIMRDNGFDFYRYDQYCQNLFAKFFDLKDSPVWRFELLLAFEVFEHLENPQTELRKMLSFSDSVLFTTELVAEDVSSDWWYFAFETGQHISFFTIDALKLLAEKEGCYFYTNNQCLHLITKKKFGHNPLLPEDEDILLGKPIVVEREEDVKLTSRLMDDFAAVKEKIKQGNV